MVDTAAYRVERLSKKHNRENFSCGEQLLDKYLKEQARQDAAKKLAATFVLVDNLTEEVAGFYSLSASAIEATEFPAVFRLSKRSTYPAILLGKLATSMSHREKNEKKQRLGELLLLDALFRCYEETDQIGAVAVILDAKKNSAAFYLKYGFLPTLDTPNRFFITMQSVIKLIKKFETPG